MHFHAEHPGKGPFDLEMNEAVMDKRDVFICFVLLLLLFFEHWLCKCESTHAKLPVS